MAAASLRSIRHASSLLSLLGHKEASRVDHSTVCLQHAQILNLPLHIQVVNLVNIVSGCIAASFSFAFPKRKVARLADHQANSFQTPSAITPRLYSTKYLAVIEIALKKKLDVLRKKSVSNYTSHCSPQTSTHGPSIMSIIDHWSLCIMRQASVLPCVERNLCSRNALTLFCLQTVRIRGL